MKKFTVLPLIAALAFFVSCQKQQTEEEKRAEVERQVQERVAAERLQDEKQRLAQEQTAIEAREKALADRENAAATPAEDSTVTETETVVSERADRRSETRSTASYGMFYQKLEPHGAWRETEDYGYVWQPAVAEESRDWRPYTEGHWVYSDAGWTWVSDEPFGWATYHYGRWLRLRRVGWVWVPGDEWAPAWVSWRTSKDYVGWAPLPPEARFDRRTGIHAWSDSYYDIGPDQYAFVSHDEFGSENVRRAVVPAERNVTIVIDTTNVTNITFANTTVINQGPNYEEMRTRSRRPIERYRLRRQSRMDGEFASARVRGDELEISAPVIVEVPDMPRPRRIKERVAEVVIDTGWTAIVDRSAADRARTRMRADATPPPNAPPKKFVKPQETSTTAATSSATPAATAAASPTARASASPAAAAASPSPTARASASPAAAASATPAAAASPTTSPTPTAKPASSATPAAAASPTPTVRTTASVTPASAASATPVARATATATASPSPKPAVASSATPTVRPIATASPSPVAKPSATAVATATPAAVATPVASPTVRTRPSPVAIPSIAPSPAASVAIPPSAPVTTPATTAAPIASPSIPPRTRPSPSITLRASPSIAPAPTLTPAAQSDSVAKPLPTLAPAQRPVVPPRATPPLPALTPPPSDAAAATATPDAPRRMLPKTVPTVPVTPPSAENPNAAPGSSPEAVDDKARIRRQRPDQTGTPKPTPAAE